MVDQVQQFLDKRLKSSDELAKLRQDILNSKDTSRATISVCGGTGCRAAGANAREGHG